MRRKLLLIYRLPYLISILAFICAFKFHTATDVFYVNPCRLVWPRTGEFYPVNDGLASVYLLFVCNMDEEEKG